MRTEGGVNEQQYHVSMYTKRTHKLSGVKEIYISASPPLNFADIVDINEI